MEKENADQKLREEIISIIVDTLEVEEATLNDNTRFADLDADSLDLVNLVVAFEDKYKLEIPDNEIKNLQTIKDVIEYIKTHV